MISLCLLSIAVWAVIDKGISLSEKGAGSHEDLIIVVKGVFHNR